MTTVSIKAAKTKPWRCLAVAGLLIVALPALSGAQTASPLGPLPAGWTVSLTEVVALFSPPTPEGSVTIVAAPVSAAEGDVKTAIIDLAPTLIEDLFGEARPAGNPMPLPASDSVAPGLMVPLTVQLDDGTEARIEATGYPLPGRRLQLFLIAAPATMSEANAELGAARTLVDQWRAAGLIVNEDLTTALGGPSVQSGSEDGDDPAGTPVLPVADAPDDRIENLIFFLRFAFDGANPAAAAEPGAVTALLLKDGRVFESEARAPADFDPSSRPPGSPGAGRWQRDGEAYALAFADGTQGTAVAAAAKTFPAPAAMAFAGRYTAIGGPPSGLLTDTIEFYPDQSALLKSKNRTLSGAYGISQRTIRFAVPGQPDAAFVFGFRGDTDAPELLILGNRVYERTD